jgi:hypothetical protein
MPVYTREQLPELLAQAAKAPSQVYLVFGERYLCRNATEQLEHTLLQAVGGTVHTIDGDREDSTTTLNKLRGYSLLPGRQIYRVTDTRLFHSKQVAKNIWERAVKAQNSGKAEHAARSLLAFLASGGLQASPDNGSNASVLPNLRATSPGPSRFWSWNRGEPGRPRRPIPPRHLLTSCEPVCLQPTSSSSWPRMWISAKNSLNCLKRSRPFLM